MPLIIVAEDIEHVREARVRLARVGHENVVCWLPRRRNSVLASGGFAAFPTEQITVDELDRRIKEQAVDQVIDVRRPGEWQSGHIRAAKHFPLSQLAQTAEELAKNRSIAVICAGGYRSSAASSVLERMGFTHITNVVGGMNAWQSATWKQPHSSGFTEGTRDAKSEILNPKFETSSNIQISKSKSFFKGHSFVWVFGLSNLFRISIFGFRISCARKQQLAIK